MEATTRELMGPVFLILGVSHAVQPAAWVRFFEVLKGTGVAGLIIFMYTLPPGLLLLVCHPTWRLEPAVFLTVAGWGMTFKGTLYAVVPRLADRMLDRQLTKTPRSYQAAGVLAAVIGGIITWQAWSARLGS